MHFIFSDCNCNVEGVDTKDGELDLTCEAETGQCHCICDVEGYQCDTCTDYHHGFPDCHGNYENKIVLKNYFEKLILGRFF